MHRSRVLVSILVLMDQPFWHGEGSTEGTATEAVSILVLMDQPFWRPDQLSSVGRRVLFVSILVLMDQPFWRASSRRAGRPWPNRLNPCSDGSAVLAP